MKGKLPGDGRKFSLQSLQSTLCRQNPSAERLTDKDLRIWIDEEMLSLQMEGSIDV